MATFCCSKGREILWPDHAPGCIAKPLSGLKTCESGMLFITVSKWALLHLPGRHWQQLQALHHPYNTVRQQHIHEPVVKSCQQSISQDHLAMPLHRFLHLAQPWKWFWHAFFFFFWDAVFIELWWDFPHALQSALPVMCGWAGPL